RENEGGIAMRVDMAMNERRLCRLQYAAGRIEACPEDRCPFWDPGGVVLDGRCSIEHVDLHANADVVHWLVELRTALKTAQTSGESPHARTRRLFHRLVDSGVREFPHSAAEITAARFRAEPDGTPPSRGDSGPTT